MGVYQNDLFSGVRPALTKLAGKMLLKYEILFASALLATVFYALLWWEFKSSVVKSVCNNPRILTVRQMGNLGNSIWEYMSLLVVSKTHPDLIPYIQEDMKGKLETVFERINIPVSDNLEQVVESVFVIPVDVPLKFLGLDSKCSHMLLAPYSARYEEIVDYGAEKIRKELIFKDNLVTYAMRTLNSIKQYFRMDGRNVTYVGMHYRGTDYIGHLEGIYGDKFKGPPDYRFYVRAMKYFKSLYKNVIFILISIDHGWLRRNKRFIARNGHVKINPNAGSNPIEDLTLLSHCNHSIINYGTFGVTAAFFSSGTTIVYDVELPLDHRGQTVAMGMAQILSNWITLPCVKDNCTELR